MLGQKEADCESEHGLPESLEIIGKTSPDRKITLPYKNNAAGCPNGTQAFLPGNPCKTNGKPAFPKGAACAAPWTTVALVSTNMVYQNTL